MRPQVVYAASSSRSVKQESEVNDAETKIATLSSKLTQIESLKGDDLMRMLPTLDVQDPTVQKILPNYQDTVAQEALLLNSGLGENHPRSNRSARPERSTPASSSNRSASFVRAWKEI
jgi:hypothetical protein